MKPWERQWEQKTVASSGAKKPWEREWARVGDSADDTPAIQEMHPEFSNEDRLIVKNFAADNEAAVGFLKKKHPNLEIKTDETGQILARGQGEKAFRTLDPDTGFFSSDFLRDAGDIGYDALSSIGSGAATAAGGIFGNIPGAMAAGVASTGGLEALRQLAGQKLGIDQDISGEDVAWAIGLGAASPLLLGTGATATQVATKSLNPFAGSLSTAKNMAAPYLKKIGIDVAESAAPVLDDAAKATMRSQSGLIGRGYDAFRDKVAPKLGAAASGVSEDVIRFARESLDDIDAPGEMGMKNFTSKIRQSTADAVQKKEAEIGEGLNKLRQLADEGGQVDEALKVDIGPARAEFQTIITRLEKHLAEEPTAAAAAELDTLKQNLEDLLPENDLVSASYAFELRQRLKDMAKPQKLAQGPFGDTHGASATLHDKRVIDAARGASKAIQKDLNRVTSLVDPAGSGAASLNSRYGQVQDIKKQLKPFLKSDDAAFGRLSTLRAPRNRVKLEEMQTIDDVLGDKKNLVKSADQLAAFRSFSDAPWLAKSSDGTTSTSRTVGAGLAGAGLGYYLGAQSGLGQGGAGVGGAIGGAAGALLGGPAAIRRYMEMQRAASRTSGKLRDLGLRPNQTVIPTWLLMRQRSIEE